MIDTEIKEIGFKHISEVLKDVMKEVKNKSSNESIKQIGNITQNILSGGNNE